MELLAGDSEQKPPNPLLQAFNLSWKYLDSHAVQLFVSSETAREFLKLIIVEIAQSGERNPIRMADLAIVQMRKLSETSNLIACKGVALGIVDLMADRVDSCTTGQCWPPGPGVDMAG